MVYYLLENKLRLVKILAQIYVVEDDTSIREIETIALKNSGHIVSSFQKAEEFYKAVKVKLPNMIILDVMLPDEDGYEILKKLRLNPSTQSIPVIMVTAKTAEIDMIRGLDIGADDYIKKPFSVMELITRVKAVLRRTMSKDASKYITVGNIFLDDERRLTYVNDEPVELTFKEFELLKLLMLNVGIVMTREVIMIRVWGTEFEGESRTVDMHIKTLRQKLKESGSQIKTVRNVGYVLE